MAYHITVDQMRFIEWARSYNWAIRFTDLTTTPEDFREWFPATDVTYTKFMVEKQEFMAGAGAFDFPKATGVYQLTLSCYDGAYRRGANTNVLQLHDWIEDWGKSIIDIDNGVLTLSEACRPLEIIHYNSISKSIGYATYAVFPHGDFSFTGSSEGDNNKLDLTFSIAGVVESSYASRNSNRRIDVRLAQP